jgi:hypothetical protein
MIYARIGLNIDIIEYYEEIPENAAWYETVEN